MERHEGEENEKPRILCLHGMRTSGLILSRQMASLRYHVDADFVFIDGPFPATGPPQKGVLQFYPNLPYYEWQSLDPEEGLHYLLDYLSDEKNGRFNGILGFSQGAKMAALVAFALRSIDNASGLKFNQLQKVSDFHGPLFYIFIGGVTPFPSSPTDNTYLEVDSLHIMGLEDPLIQSSKVLSSLFSEECKMILQHSEGHNIPSKRTDLYPRINSWIRTKFDSAKASNI